MGSAPCLIGLENFEMLYSNCYDHLSNRPSRVETTLIFSHEYLCALPLQLSF